jgi:hypothetical protein
MSLNVMVLESEPDAANIAGQELRDAGHTVLSCHDAGHASFPCRGVTQPAGCPLSSHKVDVALVVRSGNRAQPTLGEDGARCALVHRVPLVVAGTPLFDPFDEFATRTLDRTYDVVETCEQAAAAPITELGDRATQVLNELVERLPDATAEVTRRAGRLDVHVRNGRDMTRHERAQVSVRIMMTLRELDPHSAGIDVMIDGADESHEPTGIAPGSGRERSILGG